MFQRFSKLFKFKKQSTPTNNKQTRITKYFKKIIVYSFLISTGFLIYSKNHKVDIEFTFAPTSENLQIIQNCKQLRKGIYQPTYYLPTGILQFLFYKFSNEKKYIKFQQQLTLNNRPIRCIPVHNKYLQKDDMSILIIFSGSKGIDSTMHRAGLASYNKGFRTYIFQLKQFHDQSEILEAVNHLKSKYPEAKIFGIGFQYGANLLIKFSGKNKNYFKGLVAIGNPLDLQKAERSMSGIWSYILEKTLIKNRLGYAQNTEKVNTLYEVDQYVSKIKQQQLKNFKNTNSSINYIKQINVNTLFINSLDDPFSIKQLKKDPRIQNENCIYLETQQGGHQQWYQSSRASQWMMRPALQFLQYIDQKK